MIAERGMNGTKSSLGLKLYLLFMVSYFIHLPSRVPALGSIRFDLLLVGVIVIYIVLNSAKDRGIIEDPVSKCIFFLLGYIVLTIPVVEWPGSVLKQNLPIFIKAIVFFFFTGKLIHTERDLKLFVAVFLACQVFRIVEPLYLHIHEGYWGSSTFAGGGFSDRLSGAPHDIINPNGLAFIVVITFAFSHFLMYPGPMILRMAYFVLVPILLYTLVLTQSRSGFIGLVIVYAGIVVRSKRKMILVMLSVLVALAVFANLDRVHQERYLSINFFRSDVRGHGTAMGRVTGWMSGLGVFLQRPIVGHGLGTSTEAGWNVARQGQIAHNMYIEILQELGIIGFIIFMNFLYRVIKSFTAMRKKIEEVQSVTFIKSLCYSLETVVAFLLVFSMASYGLSVYPWYLVGGFCVAMLRVLDVREGAQIPG